MEHKVGENGAWYGPRKTPYLGVGFVVARQHCKIQDPVEGVLHNHPKGVHCVLFLNRDIVGLLLQFELFLDNDRSRNL